MSNPSKALGPEVVTLKPSLFAKRCLHNSSHQSFHYLLLARQVRFTPKHSKYVSSLLLASLPGLICEQPMHTRRFSSVSAAQLCSHASMHLVPASAVRFVCLAGCRSTAGTRTALY